jgi:hypothetical protein
VSSGPLRLLQRRAARATVLASAAAYREFSGSPVLRLG